MKPLPVVDGPIKGWDEKVSNVRKTTHGKILALISSDYDMNS